MAVVPQSSQNSLQMMYQFASPPPPGGISEDLDNEITKIQLGITGVGIVTALICAIFIFFLKRFQRWQALQQIIVTEDDEQPDVNENDPAAMDNAKRIAEGLEYSGIQPNSGGRRKGSNMVS